MIERRKCQRMRTRFPAVVLDRDSGEMVGHLVNITTHGIMLQSELPLDVNTDYHFRMELPDEILGRTELEFHAQSLWCNRSPNPAYYRTGLQLVRLSGDDEATIELLIKDYVFEHLIS